VPTPADHALYQFGTLLRSVAPITKYAAGAGDSLFTGNILGGSSPRMSVASASTGIKPATAAGTMGSTLGGPAGGGSAPGPGIPLTPAPVALPPPSMPPAGGLLSTAVPPPAVVKTPEPSPVQSTIEQANNNIPDRGPTPLSTTPAWRAPLLSSYGGVSTMSPQPVQRIAPPNLAMSSGEDQAAAQRMFGPRAAQPSQPIAPQPVPTAEDPFALPIRLGSRLSMSAYALRFSPIPLQL